MSQQHTIGTHKTVVFTEDGMTRVVYQSTPVVKFNSHTIVLDSGTWRSNTTKTRMNQASNQFGLGFTVYQKNFEWFVSIETDSLGKPVVIPFSDGMELVR